MFEDFLQPGKASFLLGGQFGSEGKGASAASVAAELIKRGQMFDIVTCNNGSQSGHTSIHNGQKRVLFHLPTVAVVANDDYNNQHLPKRNFGVSSGIPTVYLNAGAVIDPDVLRAELQDTGFPLDRFFIHPNAAVITQDCRDAEGRADSAQTKIASTRKGVGEALSRKVLRSGQIASQHDYLKQFCRRIDLNKDLDKGASVLVEVPQGIGLSLNGLFYPHCTSRDCTVMQAMSDAQIHPSFMGETMLVLRTKPIRVGNIEKWKSCPTCGADWSEMEKSPDGYTVCENGHRHKHGMWETNPLYGSSGGHYPDQRELSWQELGQTPELTTVTKRQRRIFSFSVQQLRDAMTSARPSHVFLAFCDYLKPGEEASYLNDIEAVAKDIGIPAPQVTLAYGPTTADVRPGDPLRRTPFGSQEVLPLNEFKS